MERNERYGRIRQRFSALINKPGGTHSAIALRAAGFDRILDSTTAICSTCDLRISEWPSDITPFQLHAQQSPTCAFVRQLLPTSPIYMQTPSSSEQPTEHHFVESPSLKQARVRTFSHWPSHMMPALTQMVAAGFFSCRVSDRVICIYCDLICQQWASEIDDPCQVHRTVSPRCVYVCSILDQPVSPSSLPVIVNASGEEASAFDRGASINHVHHRDLHRDSTTNCHICHMAERESAQCRCTCASRLFLQWIENDRDLFLLQWITAKLGCKGWSDDRACAMVSTLFVCSSAVWRSFVSPDSRDEAKPTTR